MRYMPLIYSKETDWIALSETTWRSWPNKRRFPNRAGQGPGPPTNLDAEISSAIASKSAPPA